MSEQSSEFDFNSLEPAPRDIFGRLGLALDVLDRLAHESNPGMGHYEEEIVRVMERGGNSSVARRDDGAVAIILPYEKNTKQTTFTVSQSFDPYELYRPTDLAEALVVATTLEEYVRSVKLRRAILKILSDK
jgi:hypothetical protein